MNEFYYTANPTSAHQLREVEMEVLGVRAVYTTDAGVFSRDGLDTGTRVLLEALPALDGRALDLGCGWGPVGLTLAKKYPSLNVVMTDVNARAVELSKKNLARNGARATVVQGDAFENVEGTFETIITNPPIRTGKAAIYAMFADAQNYLSATGELYIVIRKQQGAPSALKYLREIYASAEVIEREAGFWVIRASKSAPKEG